MAAAGKGQAELDRVIVNLKQIGDVGEVSAVDLKQFGFSGVDALSLLADYYGVTKDKASEMVKNSKDAFADLEGAFAKAGAEGGKFGDAFTNAMGSYNQALSNAGDTWAIFTTDLLTKSGSFDWVKNELIQFTNVLQGINIDALVTSLQIITPYLPQNHQLRVLGIMLLPQPSTQHQYRPCKERSLYLLIAYLSS